MDPYKILRINKDATPAEIKSAYRKMVAKYHPDHGGDVWVFQQIQDAYDELTGKKKKSKPASGVKPNPSSHQTNAGAGRKHTNPNSQTETHSTFKNNRWNAKKKKKPNPGNSTKFLVLGSVGVGLIVLAAALGGWLLGSRPSLEANESTETAVTDATGDQAVVKVTDRNDSKADQATPPAEPELKSKDTEVAKIGDKAEPKNTEAVDSQRVPATNDETDSTPKPTVEPRNNQASPTGATTDEGGVGQRPNPSVAHLGVPAQGGQGFVSIFNGENFAGWTGPRSVYSVQNGELVFDPKGKRLWVFRSLKQYDDFELKFEFLLSRGADNGVAIHYPGDGDPAYEGKEIQILDNSLPKYKKLAPKRLHGSVWDVLPAKKGFLKPVGQWNSQTIAVNGSQITVTLNGKIIVDGDIALAPNRASNGKPRPGLKRTSGYIGFAGRVGKVRFRNILIKTRN